MSGRSGRSLLVGAAAALVLALPGVPAVASASQVPVSLVSAAVSPVVTRTAGVTQLSDDVYNATAPGSVLYDSRKAGTALGPLEGRRVTLGSSTVTAPSDATAAILNVTAVSPTRSGWLAVWPSDVSQPATSTLNFVPGTPTSNLAVVGLNADREVVVRNGSAGTTHVLISLRGWVRSNSGTTLPGSVTATSPTRVLDTRTIGGAVPARGYRDVKVTGVGVPVGAGAALLNVVAVTPKSAGYLIAHPSDTARPTSTLLTYRVGSSRAAMSLLRLSAAGTVRLWNMSSAPVHMVLDSFGWVAAGDASRTPMGTAALTPRRVLDTRTSTGALRAANGYTADVPLPVAAGAAAGFSPSGAVLALTATGATRSGYLDIDVSGDPATVLRTPSVLNFGAGETVTNTTYVTVPATGHLRVHAGTTGSVHVVIDLVGVVSHRGEFRGRVVNEADGTALYPAAAGSQLGYTAGSFVAPAAADGTYRWGYNNADDSGIGSAACATAMTTPGSLTTHDTRYAVGCIGGTPSPTYFDNALGAVVDVGDVPVARVGTISGVVTRPVGSGTARGGLSLMRTDGLFGMYFLVDTTGIWSAQVPVGDYVVTADNVGVSLQGETIDEIPHGDSLKLADLLAAGAKTFHVSAAATTAVGEAQLKAPGRLNWTVVDPDGNYAGIQVIIRHQSGMPVFTNGASSAQRTFLLRPGGYTVCATEATVTVCNGGASSPDTAPLLEVTDTNTNPGVSTTITLP